jgi:hypothetical protein
MSDNQKNLSKNEARQAVSGKGVIYVLAASLLLCVFYFIGTSTWFETSVETYEQDRAAETVNSIDN